MKKIIPALIFTAAAAGATAIYIKKKLFDNNKVKLIELEFQQDEDNPGSTEVQQQDEVLVEVNVLPQHETKVEETVEQSDNVELASDNEEVNSIQEESVEQSEKVEFVSDNEEVDSVQDEETVDDLQNEEIEDEDVQDGLLTEEEIVEEIEPVISDEELSEIEQIVDQFVTQQQSEKTESIADDHLSFQEDQVDTVAQIDDITTEIDQIIGDIINQDETSNETLSQDEIETIVDENTIDDLISNLEEQKANQQAMDDIEQLIEDEVKSIDESEMSDDELIEKFSKQYPAVSQKRISLILTTIDRMLDAVGKCDYITLQHFIEFEDEKQKESFSQISSTVGYETEPSRKNKELILSAIVINNRLTIAHTILSLSDNAADYHGNYNGWAVKSTE
ncbi:MAG: hypothetical protein SPK49_03640 [Erysipelotrichaceae bacterium]|nr:hypothetical protein [Erysipelotrichaceae bacterium]